MWCLSVKVIIAMICRDLCDFLLTWNNDFAISLRSMYCEGKIAECRRKFRGLHICMCACCTIFIFNIIVVLWLWLNSFSMPRHVNFSRKENPLMKIKNTENMIHTVHFGLKLLIPFSTKEVVSWDGLNCINEDFLFWFTHSSFWS